MTFLYWLFARLSFLLYALAALFNKKAKLFVEGRKNWRRKLKDFSENKMLPHIWFHCASVGEFEQARPIIESIRERKVDCKIILTFFSPSGYELRKNYTHADLIAYLPLDTPANAKDFVALIKPDLVIFIKYEFWHYYLKEIKKQQIPFWSVSSIFRSNQIYFSGFGAFYVNILKNVSRFYVQNQESVSLLKKIGIENVVQAGDSRFDRVIIIAENGTEIELARVFAADKKVLVAGSVWQEDIQVIIPFLKNNVELHAIIAPHELDEKYFKYFEKEFPNLCVRFSKSNEQNIFDKRILLIDNVGMLSKLYKYGQLAYIGGAFGKGLHNTLEAACYGIPVFFGNKNYQKFLEAKELISEEVAYAIANENEWQLIYQQLQNAEWYDTVCLRAKTYVKSKTGTTKIVVDAIINQLA